MKQFIRSLLGKGAAPAVVAAGATSVADADEDIPRYPPFAKGLPAAKVDRILLTQQDLIQRIRHTLALSSEEFSTLVEPVLRNYASYVHLLPASETHHHRGAGGLFRHGLEVAFWATQSSEGIMFTYSTTPREKKEQEPRWRLATCLAGLLHDIGKPATDLSVTSKDGALVWNPYGETLSEWAHKHNIDRYFLRWRSGRHKSHEQFSILVVDKIVTQQTLGWLTKAGPDILQAMLVAISGTNSDHVVSNLVLRADNTSVERDLKSHNIVQTDGSLGVPVEKYILDAMRRLINSSEWLINQKGARVWVLRDGLYIVWKQAAEDIIRVLASDRVPGIPRAADTLADILIERTLAIPQPGDSVMARYWNVAPDALVQEDGSRVSLLMLKLSSNEVLFSNEPPPPVNAIIKQMDRGQPKEEAAVPPAVKEDKGPSIHKQEPATKKKAGIGQTNHNSAISDPLEVAFGGVSDSAPVKANKNPSPTTGEVDDPFESEPPRQANDQPATKQTHTQKEPATDKKAVTAKPSPKVSVTIPDTDGVAGNTSSDTDSWLEKQQGDSGKLLHSIVRMLHEQPRLWGKSLGEHQGRVVIQYPDGAAAFGEPPSVLKALDEGGYLDLDPTLPMKKVRVLGPLKGLVLKDKPSQALLLCRRVVKSDTQQESRAEETRKTSVDDASYLDEVFGSPKSVPEHSKNTKDHSAHQEAASPVESEKTKVPPPKTAAMSEKKGDGKQKAKAKDRTDGKPKTKAKKNAVTPSAHALSVAERIINDVRAKNVAVPLQVLTTKGDTLVVPISIIGGYIRLHGDVSPWEVREAIRNMPGAEFKDGKILVKEHGV